MPTTETVVTIFFTEEDGKTKMTFRQTPFDSVEQRDSHEEGWSESFEGLAAYVTGQWVKGFSKARLERMHDVMAGFVERAEVPGLVTLIGRRGEVHLLIFGIWLIRR